MAGKHRTTLYRYIRRVAGLPSYAVRLTGWLLLVAGAGPALADDTLIERRQAVFEELEERLEQVEARLDNDSPEWQALASDAGKARELAAWLHEAFPRGSAEGSRAKEKIWDDGSDFSRRLTRLSDAVDRLSRAGAEADREQAAIHLEAANDTCRGCHMRYRSLFSWSFW